MRTLLIILFLIIVGYFLLQYANPKTKKNADTALKQASREVVEKTKEGYNELKQKAKEEKVPEKVEQGAKELGDMALDASITAAITAKMAADDTVKATDIDVDTKNGNVTLSGSVSSKAESDRAVAIAKEAEGVKSVTSHLVVKAA
ncbi:BON domain-containing protein [bacterium]|nr:BON domain-containing protein [bacterium]